MHPALTLTDEPHKALLYTLKRPVTDGRLRVLIPYLTELCGYKTVLQSLNQPSSNSASKYPLLAEPPAGNVRYQPSLFIFVRKTLKVKPALIYINSTDLQVFTIPFRILFGYKTWVDLLENDVTNTRYNQRRKGAALSAMSFIVSRLQKLLPWNNLVTLAEECFYNEIKFGKAWPVLLTHELVPLPISSVTGKPTHPLVLVTGTLGLHYGTLEAIAWSKALQAVLPHNLRIAGHAPHKPFAKALATASAQAGVELQLFNTYVPQEHILVQMAQATHVLFSYVVSPATQHRIPTKFAEAASRGCTLIIPNHAPWVRWCRARAVPYLLLDPLFAIPAPCNIGLQKDWPQQRLYLQQEAILAAIRQL